MSKVDSRGRILIPKEMRKKLDIQEGEEFIPVEVNEDTILLRRVNTKKMLKELIEKAKDANLEELEEAMEERGDEVAREKFEKIFG